MSTSDQIQICFPEATGRQSLTLSIGQRFVASIRHSAHGLIVKIGEHRLPAQAKTPLADGDRLILEVADISHGLTLRVVDHCGQNPALQSALRHAIPHQSSAAELIDNLCQESAAPAPTTAATSTAESIFINALPTLRTLQNPGRIRHLLANSGLFCEYGIANSAAREELASDLKVQLLRWLRALRSPAEQPHPSSHGAAQRDRRVAHDTHKRILHSAENFLQRIIALQIRLAVHQQEDWSFELPLRDGDRLGAARLRIRRTTDGNSSIDGAALTIDTHLRLPAAGPMYIALFLHGKQIDCAWWSSCANTAKALQASLPQLRHRLADNGLELRHCNIQHGWPSHDQTAPSVDIPQGMIHEQI